MEEARDPKSAVNVSDDEGAGSARSPKRDKEATSSETLSDLEKSEKATGGASSSDTGSSLEGSSPKPMEEGGGRADGSDSGGPM